jgi:hypothetical protein
MRRCRTIYFVAGLVVQSTQAVTRVDVGCGAGGLLSNMNGDFGPLVNARVEEDFEGGNRPVRHGS